MKLPQTGELNRFNSYRNFRLQTKILLLNEYYVDKITPLKVNMETVGTNIATKTSIPFMMV